VAALGCARDLPEVPHEGGAHDFPGGHDAKFLLDTISVEVTRVAVDRALVVVRARGAAHRVPTGDPFRRLVVELCASPGCDEPIARPMFARSFRRVAGRWRLAVDSALPPARDESVATREVRLEAAPAVLYWRLVLASAAASSEGALDVGDREIEIARGVVR
jgi:hypothetical protein